MGGRAARELNVEEWAALPEDEEGELVDGVLVEEEMPSYLHELVVAALVRWLDGWGEQHDASVAGSEAKFAVGRRRGRKPDLTVYLSGARRPPVEGVIRVPPSIAIEVVSASPSDHRRDRIEKMHDYAAFGVRWYWLIDPKARTFEVFELDASGRYAVAVSRADGRVDNVPGCEGLVLDLDALWRRLDRAIADSARDA